MTIFDLHQDLLSHMRFQDQFGQTEQTSFDAIATSDIDLLVATAFPIPPDDNQRHASVPQLITEELEMYREYVESHQDWKLIEIAEDLISTNQKLLLHLEGLNLFDGSAAAWQQLNEWRELGVRSIGTHWNIENHLGGGTLQPDVPLTSLGAEVIAYLEENNILFDMSHMGRQTFWDAAAYTNRPLYVSHGNANAICSHMRNYTDEQIRAIAETDGVIGIFLANTFVSGRNAQSTRIDVVAHIRHIQNLVGIRHVAIGSDFGGIVTGGVIGLEHVRDLEGFIAELPQYGFTEDDVVALTHQNALRVLQAHLS